MVTEVPAEGIEKLAPRKMSLSVPTIQSSAFVNFSPGADSESEACPDGFELIGNLRCTANDISVTDWGLSLGNWKSDLFFSVYLRTALPFSSVGLK